ncbi:peptidase domain-containing ABC transporter [Sphingobacterium humi]|uniref:Peptide cleavage/export ABC transporter n=1 Tax=Sphingobacterium humi TaxID=1796905 RepID=A0A6N8KZT8_9SPHI|nr:peptidase domain-containing ABC transporter [Sphingobacterium humi]MVZ62596.1 peptide cleavage/export ABC transporter [Sphingobacterium humi]
MKKGIRVKQQDLKDCGAACLASIGAYYDLYLPIAKIRQICHTDTRGTNALGLVVGLEKMGFKAKGVKAEELYLDGVPLPAIAHVVKNQVHLHYVVVYQVRRGKVKFMDPEFGEMQEMSQEEFNTMWTGVLILAEPNEYFEAKNERVSRFRRFVALIQPHRSILFQSLLGAIVYTVLGLSMAIYIQKITDYVLIDGNLRLLNLLSVGMLIILFFQIIIGYLQELYIFQTGQKIDRHLILGYYKHLLDLPQRFFDTMKIGEITSRINDAVKIRSFINDVSVELLVHFFTILFSFAVMFTYHWRLATIMLLSIPLYVLVYVVVNRLNKQVERKVMEDSAVLQSQLVESLNAMKTVKQFGVEGFQKNKTDNAFDRLLKSVYRSMKNVLFSGKSTEVISRIFTIILIWVGAYFVINKEITAGELLSFYALIGYLTGPISSLVNANKTIQSALIASDRLFEIMDLEREETLEKFDLKPSQIGDVRLEHISFSYGTRRDVFEDFSCTFEKGKITALIGESGSGKSTISNLLQNLYPLQEGKIQIGEYDIKYISNYSLRKLVAAVPQQIHLFSGNVIDNIALGDEHPDMERIIAISKDIGILSFIESLPNGFQTHLGEDGALLSGGQKQRIAIARALYRDPEILILDEATSSLDSDAESFVQAALRKFKEQGKTMIVIAHRLSTIAAADKIIVIEDGALIEEGTHQELLAKNEKYASLWRKQGLALS